MKFWFLVLFFVLNLSAQSTQDKIKSSKTSLRSNEAMSQQLNKRLDDLAKDIVSGENNLKKSIQSIDELKEQISLLETGATEAGAQLEALTKQNKELVQTQRELEQNIIRIIAEDLSYELMIEGDEERQSEDEVMVSHILNRLNSVVKEDFKRISKNYEQTINLIKSQNNKIEQINNTISNHKRKQAELAAMQTKQRQTISDLKRDREIYNKKLTKLQAQQDEIRQTLEQLAIVQKQEEAAAAKAKREQEAAARAKKDKKQAAKSDNSVRQVGSSYQSSSVKRYTGAKTIAPLESFTVKQKFGNYIDPIYNIKIFNESVILSSNTPDAKVKSVLSGKVVFAKQTAILERVVIIENENGIHTIYAHLSQIAPTISVGAMVQKGAVIGRVRDDLTFEVTQKNYHIDPLELISLK